jgi:dienelactone hydrolase
LRKVRLGRVVLALICGLAPAALPAAAQAAPFSTSQLALRARDGIGLRATMDVPKGPVAPPDGYPAVVVLHGWGANRSSVAALAGVLAARGYVTLAFDLRGWGQSGGVVDLDGPATIQDAKDSVTWLARGTALRSSFHRPRIDPNAIGMTGVSYGGGTTLNAAAAGAKLAAIAPIIPWSNLQEALEPGGVLKSGYVGNLLQQCAAGTCGSLLGTLYTLAGDHADDALVQQAMGSRSAIDNAAALRLPVFLLQGRRDYLFPPEQTIDLYQALPGPKRLYIGLLGHPPATDPPSEVPYYTGEIVAWFDHYLKGVDNGIQNRAPVEYAADPDPVSPGSSKARFDPRAAASFSSVRQGTDHLALYLHTGGTLSDQPPTGDEPEDTIAAPGGSVDPATTGATFVSTAPAAAPLSIRGRPTITLPLASSDGFTHVFAELWWQKGSQSALFGWGARYFLPPLTATAVNISLDTMSVVADIPAGATLRVVVEGSTSPAYSSWFALGFGRPNPPGSHLELLHSALAPASVVLPVAPLTPAPSLAVTTSVHAHVATLRTRAPHTTRVSWSFGDGSPLARGTRIRHRYPAPGTYAGMVTAYARSGAATTVPFSVRVS